MVQAVVKSIVALLMKRPITAEIALQVGAIEGFEHLEIVNGEWVINDDRPEDMTGEKHGRIEGLLIIIIGGYVMAHNLGYVYPGDTDFVLDGTPDDIRLKRQPDVAFVAGDRTQSTSGYYFLAPDLTVEIVSPSQTRPEMLAKASEYLMHGSRQVWLVFPEKQLVEVHSPNHAPEIYHAGDVIPGGDILPGFTLEVTKIFDV